MVCGAQAQEAPVKPEEVDAKSLPLRTALHHDATLGPPLERLLELYRAVNKVSQLVDTYRQHVAQYPADTGAWIVLVRLLSAVNDSTAGTVAKQAAERFRDEPFLQFLQYEHLQKTHERGALEALNRAITKETQPARKRKWIDLLLPLAAAENRPELARQHLEAIGQAAATPSDKLEIARKMIAQKLPEPALALLKKAAAMQPAAEIGVDIELASASAESALSQTEAAAARLDALLARIAADYWRRGEILRRRTALVKTDAEREKMLAAARQRLAKAPGDAFAALELAQLLAAFEFRREALAVLEQAANAATSGGEGIEKAALELYDLLRDERGREAFLARRVQAAPHRHDLALARARSLFLLSRTPEALAALDALTPKLEESARLPQLLELARFLRKQSQPAEAAEIFQRAQALAPERLDLRRELAETWLALGKKEKAREVFAKALPPAAETEQVLDLLQFLLAQSFLREAGTVLEASLAREPANFELRLAQVQLTGRLGDLARGRELLAESRKLADTIARYRRWVQAAVTFHDLFEVTGEFLGEEKDRLLTSGGWSGDDLERRLAWLDSAVEKGDKTAAAEFCDAALAGDLPDAVKIELRRRRFALVENEPAKAAEAQQQLTALIKDDPARASEYKLRLAMLHARAQQGDRYSSMVMGPSGAAQLLEGIDVEQITSVPLLTGIQTIIPQADPTGNLLARVLERIVTLEPANRVGWELWMSDLASRGDEEKLRTGLRRLLGGIDKLTIPDESRSLLRQHLLSSYWRSAHAHLSSNESAPPPSFAEALPLLDEADRAATEPKESLWIAWTRTYVLNALGQQKARDEALGEVERLAAVVAAQPVPAAPQSVPALPPSGPGPAMPVLQAQNAPLADQKPAPAPLMITFPDGLSMHMDDARELLTRPPTETKRPISGEPGVRGGLKLRWAFETDARSPIVSITSLGAERVAFCDATSHVSVVDRKTGKLLWKKTGTPPLKPAQPEYGGYYGQQMAVSYPQLAGDAERLFMPEVNGLQCWSVKDGALLWRAEQLVRRTPAASMQRLLPRAVLAGSRVLLCDPVSMSVTALDPQNGKVVWQREYGASLPAQVPLSDLMAGVSYSEGRLLLYGAGTVIIDAATGALRWRFNPQDVQTFPISLAPPSAQPAMLASMAYSRGGYPSGQPTHWISGTAINGRYPGYRGMPRHGYGVASQPFAYGNPAVVWSAFSQDSGQPRLGLLQGNRLMLMAMQGGVSTLYLDRPFHTSTAQGQGTFVGFSGQSPCLLSAPNVYTVDAVHSSLRLVVGSGGNVLPALPGDEEAPEETPITADGVKEAATDGFLVYVTTGRGVAVHHPRTGEALASLKWPKLITPPAPKTAGAAPGTHVVSGMVSISGASFFSSGRHVQFDNGQSVYQPRVATVLDRVYYTPITPHQIAAVGPAEEAATAAK